MIIELSRTLYNFKILRIILVSGVVLIIGITGFQHTISMAAYSNNDQYYEATTFISHYLGNHEHDNLTIMSDAFYRWIPRYVFDLTVDYQDYTNPLPTNNSILLVVDSGFLSQMRMPESLWNGSNLLKYYYHSNDSKRLVTFPSDRTSSNNVSLYLYNNTGN